MFKTIVTGVDGSVNSQNALEYAANLSENYGAGLIVVHAYPRISDLRGFSAYDKLVAKRKSAGQKVLDAARAKLGNKSIDFEEDLLEGPAANAVLKVAETRNADLVVLGTSGIGSLKSLVLGSVSTKVMHCAICPVLVVR